MTPFSMLLHAGGFPPKEAARILEVREDTVRQWIKGRREPPIDALIAMATYVAHQVSVADEVIEQVVQDTEDSVELGIATDDAEAQSLGWPSALAQHRVIGRITADRSYRCAARLDRSQCKRSGRARQVPYSSS